MSFKLPNGENEPVYDRIGGGYASYRKSDPAIFSRIQAALASCATILNIGAGAGSYEPSTCRLAVEPSRRMIEQRVSGSAPCVQAVAEGLPLRDQSFDGSMAVLTLHHWTDVRAGLAEMCRVTRKRIVLFTWDPDYEADFWLTRDYLPAILSLDRPRFPAMPQLRKWLPHVRVQIVPIPAHCQDGFTGAYWKRPHAFLDRGVQQSNSVLAQLDPQQVRQGIQRLREDLATGAWSSKNAELEPLSELDLGYRLIISNLHESAQQ